FQVANYRHVTPQQAYEALARAHRGILEGLADDMIARNPNLVREYLHSAQSTTSPDLQMFDMRDQGLPDSEIVQRLPGQFKNVEAVEAEMVIEGVVAQAKLRVLEDLLRRTAPTDFRIPPDSSLARTPRVDWEEIVSQGARRRRDRRQEASKSERPQKLQSPAQ